MEVLVTTATAEHAAQLAPLLRAGDLAECLAAGFASGLEALGRALAESSEALTVLFDGEVAAMVGVDILDDDRALVWALTGRAVDRARLTFVRTSKQVLEHFLRSGLILVNLVDARYQGALDWLEVLGFRIGPVVPHPATGLPFRLAEVG